MGASLETCAARYGVAPNCTVVLSPDGKTALALGDVTPENLFLGDPDIAGIGVLSAFLCVTATAIWFSILSMAWWLAKNIFHAKIPRLGREYIDKEEKDEKNWHISIAGMLETLIISCSDQQVFTGGAYAITLRYAKACSVSAYHYNIVANILLVTCATHLVAMTVSRNYWRHPAVGVLRITVTSLLFVLTGNIISNQGSGSRGFPTEVPHETDTYSLMLLPAACFQSGEFLLDQEMEKAFNAGSLDAFFSGQIHGWTQYLIMFLFYLIAVVISLARIINRGNPGGKRRKFTARLQRALHFQQHPGIHHFFRGLFGLYLVAGIALSSWTVAIASIYVFELRQWVDKSVWIERTGDLNPENDPSTFGQLVPMLLMTLTIFSFLQIISERIQTRRAYRKDHDDSDSDSDDESHPPPPGSNNPTFSSTSSSIFMSDFKDGSKHRSFYIANDDGTTTLLYQDPTSETWGLRAKTITITEKECGSGSGSGSDDGYYDGGEGRYGNGYGYGGSDGGEEGMRQQQVRQSSSGPLMGGHPGVRASVVTLPVGFGAGLVRTPKADGEDSDDGDDTEREDGWLGPGRSDSPPPMVMGRSGEEEGEGVRDALLAPTPPVGHGGGRHGWDEDDLGEGGEGMGMMDWGMRGMGEMESDAYDTRRTP